MNSTLVRRTGTVGLLGLALAFTTACGPGQGADPQLTEDIEGVGAIGTGSPTNPDDLSASTDAPVAYTFPGTVEAYAEAVVEAWAGDDPDWLQALTAEAVYYGIFDLDASPYDVWTLLRCDGAAGSSYCSFLNPDGDVLTLRISHALLGQADAATEVNLDKTVYPNDSVLYVQEFVKAWQFGNTARMVKLSSQAVVNKVPGTPPTSVTYLPVTCCGGGLAQVKVKIGNPTARFDVGTTKLGGPNAILDYAVEFGFSN
jgi:hypothetical protein